MPACSSSPIDLLAARIGSTSDGVTGADEPADLVAALAAVPDPRSRRGIRHRLVTVLALAVCAVLAGARSYVAIAEWAHDLPLGVRIQLGLTIRRATPERVRDPPAAAEDRPAGAGPGGVELADHPRRRHRLPAIRGAGADRRQPAVPDVVSRVIAVDGKSARRGRHADGRAVHLLAAFDTGSGIVLGQSVVDGKSNEITAFTPRSWTGSTSPALPRTCPRSAPGTAPRTWPPCATWPSAATASSGPPTSPRPAGTSPDTPTGSCHCSHNGQINYAGPCVVVRPTRVTKSQPSGPCEGCVLRSTAQVPVAGSAVPPRPIVEAHIHPVGGVGRWRPATPCGRRKRGAMWDPLPQRQDHRNRGSVAATALQTPLGDYLGRRSARWTNMTPTLACRRRNTKAQ